MKHEHQDDSSSRSEGSRARGRSEFDPTAPPAHADPLPGDERTQPGPDSGPTGDLDPARHHVDGVDDALDAELVGDTDAQQRAVLGYWKGELPRPNDLADYERILPGIADRLVTMNEYRLELAGRELELNAERERTVRAAVDSEATVREHLADADAAAIRRGQWLTWTVAIGATIVALVGLILGHPAAVFALVVPALQVGGYLVRTVSESRQPPPAAPTGNDEDQTDRQRRGDQEGVE